MERNSLCELTEQYRLSDPTELFANLEPRNPPNEVSEQNKVCLSPDFEAPNWCNVRSGSVSGGWRFSISRNMLINTLWDFKILKG